MGVDLSKVVLKTNDLSVNGRDFGDKAESPAKRAAASNLTTTKLRRIYALVTNVSAQIENQEDFKMRESDIRYLKVKMAYEAGREPSVRSFIDDSGLMKLLDAVDSYEKFVLYCRYAESLVAYFKYHGGKDN